MAIDTTIAPPQYADTSGEDNGFVRRLVGLEPQYRLQEKFMFNKLVIALAALSLGIVTPGNAQTRANTRTPELSTGLGNKEYTYHKRLNRDFDRQPYCNRYKSCLIRDVYTGRLKCVSRHRYERHNSRYGW